MPVRVRSFVDLDILCGHFKFKDQCVIISFQVFIQGKIATRDIYTLYPEIHNTIVPISAVGSFLMRTKSRQFSVLSLLELHIYTNQQYRETTIENSLFSDRKLSILGWKTHYSRIENSLFLDRKLSILGWKTLYSRIENSLFSDRKLSILAQKTLYSQMEKQRYHLYILRQDPQ